MRRGILCVYGVVLMVSRMEFKGSKMNLGSEQEDNEPGFSIKKAHFKFSQLGASDKAPGHKGGQDDDQEIVEEVIDACVSPLLKMKSKIAKGGLGGNGNIGFKFEEVIDETIEEDIEADLHGDETNK